MARLMILFMGLQKARDPWEVLVLQNITWICLRSLEKIKNNPQKAF